MTRLADYLSRTLGPHARSTPVGELEARQSDRAARRVRRRVEITRLKRAFNEAMLALEARSEELKQTLLELEDQKKRTERLYWFGKDLAAELEAQGLAELVLDAVLHAARADCAALYVVDEEGVFRRAGVLGLDPATTPVTVYDDSTLSLSGSGGRVSHELQLRLAQADRSLGIVSVGRLGERPFSDAEREMLGHILDQSAIAFANVASLANARRLADINRAVVEATPDAVVVVDLNGRRLLQNAAMETMSEGSDQPLSDESVFARMAELADATTDPETFRATLDACIADPEWMTDLEFETVPGTRFYYLYTAPVRNRTGEPIARLFLLRDVTAERETERLKSELLATVSHEVRTPLASVLGFSELLATRRVDTPTRERYAELIHREARRLAELVNDFLDLQRIEAGRFTLDLRPFDLRPLLEEQVAFFAGQSAGHRLALAAPDGPLEIAGERGRIAQVLANLLSNAIKYSPAGGQVDLVARLSDGNVRVAVRDRGIGIPSDQHLRIFTKFFRVDSSDTREIGGTGLGLALAREIIEAHGGRIGFESTAGVGSTFWFELEAEVSRAVSAPQPEIGIVPAAVPALASSPSAGSQRRWPTSR